MSKMNTSLMFSSDGDLWRTERPLVAWLNSRFDFTLDAAASDTLVAPSFIDAEQNALATPWHGRAYCNWPYSAGDKFVRRGISEALTNPKVEGVCMLGPARTDTAWWQDSFYQWNRIELLRGRLKFWLMPDELAIINAARAAKGKKPLGAENSAQFPSALLIAGFGLKGHTVECVDWRKEAKKVAA